MQIERADDLYHVRSPPRVGGQSVQIEHADDLYHVRSPHRGGGRRSKCKGQIQSRRPYIRASEAAVRVSLEESESRVEPAVWRESAGESQGLRGDQSRGELASAKAVRSDRTSA